MSAFVSALVNVIIGAVLFFAALNPVSKLSLAASFLILAVFAVRLICRRIMPKNLLFILWIVVIARLLVPFTVTTPVSIFNVYEPFGIRYDGDFPYRDVKLTPDSENTTDDAVEDNAVSDTVADTASTDELRAHPIAIALRIGVPLLLSSVLVSYVLTAGYLKRAKKVEDERVLNIMSTMKHHKKVSLVTRQGNDTIMIFGILRPTVILPEDYESIDDVSLRYLLMHEMEHYYHADAAWNILMLIACFIHWFNPLVWIARKLFLNDMETACDERVLRRLNDDEKTAFAETLVDFAARSVRKKPMTAMAFGKNNVKDRVTRITRYKKLSRTLCVISAALILTVSMVFATGAVNIFDREDFVYGEWVSIDEYTMNGEGELLKNISLLERVYVLDGVPANSYLRHEQQWFTTSPSTALMVNKNAPLPIFTLPVKKMETVMGDTTEVTDSGIIEAFKAKIEEADLQSIHSTVKKYDLRVYFDVECELVWSLTVSETADGKLYAGYNTAEGKVYVDVTDMLREISVE